LFCVSIAQFFYTRSPAEDPLLQNQFCAIKERNMFNNATRLERNRSM
jgi:hypothetical protein